MRVFRVSFIGFSFVVAVVVVFRDKKQNGPGAGATRAVMSRR